VEELGLRARRPAACLGLALALCACDQPDVDERLQLQLANDGTARVEFAVAFPDSARTIADEARRDRVSALQQSYLEGWDPWAARFEGAGRAGETLAWERVEGELRTLTRTARLTTPEALADFFADTDLTVLFTPDPEESELAIYAASSSRATREQRERLVKSLAQWSEAVVTYLQDVAELYAYLDAHEDRAESVMQAIFATEAELVEGEEERLDRLLGELSDVLQIAGAADEEGESLERLARLVYDPFPAPLAVAIDGRLLASQGFVPLADGTYEVPPLGLERALSELEERWITPPLLTTYERLQRLPSESGFDVAEFASRPRAVRELPTAKDVVSAVAKLLQPATEYRLRWRPSPPALE
jgi:hypothetical protein